MLDPKEYAKQLVEKYLNLDYCSIHLHAESDGNICQHLADQCALIDVQNTIDALIQVRDTNFSFGSMPYTAISVEIKRFEEVKEHIKQL